jgi:hypothetical protein
MFDLNELKKAKSRKRHTGDTEDSYSMAGSMVDLKKNKTDWNFNSPGKMTKAASSS